MNRTDTASVPRGRECACACAAMGRRWDARCGKAPYGAGVGAWEGGEGYGAGVSGSEREGWGRGWVVQWHGAARTWDATVWSAGVWFDGVAWAIGHGMGWRLLVVRVRGRKGLGALRGLVTCVCVVYRIWILEIWPPHV